MSDLEILLAGFYRGFNVFANVALVIFLIFGVITAVTIYNNSQVEKTYCFGDGHDESGCKPFPPGCSASTPTGVNGCP